MTSSFSRDNFTWFIYLTLGYYAYLLNAIGPAMPFLRAELDLSYTLSSAHLSAFAVGILLAGLGGDWLITRFGRHIVDDLLIGFPPFDILRTFKIRFVTARNDTQPAIPRIYIRQLKLADNHATAHLAIGVAVILCAVEITAG